jgi:large subunit ribosomal protein L18
MKAGNTKIVQRARRRKRIRAKLFGTALKPRLSIFKSNKFIYAQIIDDMTGKTLAAASDMDIKKGGRLSKSEEVGKLIADRAKEKKIKKVIFDRGGFIYTGRIKALAESARAGGLEF